MDDIITEAIELLNTARAEQNWELVERVLQLLTEVQYFDNTYTPPNEEDENTDGLPNLQL